jgi:hypothetical protein
MMQIFTLELEFFSFDDVFDCQTQTNPILQLLYFESNGASFLEDCTIDQSESLIA